MSKYLWVESTSKGKTWQLYTFKPQGRPAYAAATEGEVTERGEGYQVFTTMLFQDRQVTEPIAGAATVKRKKQALHMLLHKLVNAGAVSGEAALAAHAQVDAATVA